MRIVVVDDHHLFRAGVRAELAAHHEVVGEAGTPAEAIAVIAEAKPDVVLLDVHLPEGGGVAVLEALPAEGAPKVLALSVSDAAEDVVPMIRAGALDIHHGDTIGLVVDTGCAYFAPTAFPDTIHAGIRVDHIGTSSVRYAVGLFRNDDEDAAAAGRFTHVYVGRDTRRPVPLPEGLRTALDAIRI